MQARIEGDAKGRKRVLDACDQPCAIERGMRILGGKWTGSILWHLKDEPVRFNDLARMIGGGQILLTRKALVIFLSLEAVPPGRISKAVFGLHERLEQHERDGVPCDVERRDLEGLGLDHDRALFHQMPDDVRQAKIGVFHT